MTLDCYEVAQDIPDTKTSLFQGSDSVEIKLNHARLSLLDLSARNRLLNAPRGAKGKRSIEIVDERSAEVYRLLVKEEQAFTFLPGRSLAGTASEGEETDEIADLAQPEDDSVDERGIFRRHTDTRLQTRLTSKGLQKRLLEMYSDAITLEQEQGVNILFLSLGMLKWIDPKDKKFVRYAPLILVPVALSRTSAADRFKLRWRHEDVASNLSLEAFLDREHRLKITAFDAGEETNLTTYFDQVAETIAQKEGWEVLPDAQTLGFFSFAKFLMYRDLDNECWPEDGKLAQQKLIRSLLTDGFEHQPLTIPEDAFVDDYIPVSEMLHVADADSSQMKALYEARQGRSLIIQGPPGTGKSQTIANIIATAIADGKTVLFVAEKMVALSVVKSRLDRLGVGDACLELHSNKANKRAVLQELRRTWELGTPQVVIPPSLNGALQQTREQLNSHAAGMNHKHPVAELTPFQVVGELANLARQGRNPGDFALEEGDTWTPDDVYERESLLRELAQRITDMGLPDVHPWRGVKVENMLPTDVTRLMQQLTGLHDRLAGAIQVAEVLAGDLNMATPQNFEQWSDLHSTADRLASAPKLEPVAFASAAWDAPRSEAEALLRLGDEYAALEIKLAGLDQMALHTDVSAEVALYSKLPPHVSTDFIERIAPLRTLLQKLLTAAVEVRHLLGVETEDEISMHSVRSLLVVAKGVAEAPAASPEVFAAAVWQFGLDRAADLAEAAVQLEDSRRSVGERLIPAAWETDFSSARLVLASHGTSVMRHLSGEWRSANRLVGSMLQNSKLPVSDVLSLLDELAKGQKARKRLLEERAFGQEAFGNLWRDDRSSASELSAVVAWFKGLGTLREEVRLIAARTKEQSAIAREYTVLAHAETDVSTVLRQMEPGVLSPLDDVAELMREADLLLAAERRVADLFIVKPNDLGGRTDLLKTLQTLQRTTQELEAGKERGEALFGAHWDGVRSDWRLLREAAVWVWSNPDLRHIAAEQPDTQKPLSNAATLLDERTVLRKGWSALLMRLGTDENVLQVSGASPYKLLEHLERWLANPEQLSKWTAYLNSFERTCDRGLRPFAERLADARIEADEVSSVFAMAYYEGLLRAMFSSDPGLAQFDGEIHRTLNDRFVELDRARLAVSAVEVVKQHHRRIPPSGGIGPVGVLRAETVKKTRHLPIRQLMHKAAPAVQALKPVLMMSPLSIAQFLPPGDLTFDLLVMDEASQIQPVDALGAIARCRQVIVVGDERQLPPTRFFAKMTSDVEEDEEEDDSTRVGDIESILGLFIARGLPQRMLLWHYRSRHQSLIAVSNSQFYDNKLFVIPSPMSQEGGRGLHYQFVPDGVFYSESNAVDGRFANPIEARVIAEAVMRHAIETPGQSLGVATFSTRQRKAILDQIELLRRLNPSTEPFFNDHSAEPFFIKNLENVQGDERDVILISVGYGRDPEGKFAMRFGPLGMDGGERRLNVLISRAKLRCVVYASITDEDFDMERVKSKGVFALKLFLHFARTGRLDVVHTPETARQKSVFATQAAVRLRDKGYVVHEHVGISGCFVDLAVIDPGFPERYALGIEVDGPSYSDLKSSRDRDRLRREVLEGHGWAMHRVWALDWLHRPGEQLERCLAALTAQRERLQGNATERTAERPGYEVVTIDRHGVEQMGLVKMPDRESGDAYIESALPRPSTLDIHETPVALLADCVCQIVAVEGPIHSTEVVTRLRAMWGLKQAGSRIRIAATSAIALARSSGRLDAEGEFLFIPDAPVLVRDRSAALSLNLRKPEMLRRRRFARPLQRLSVPALAVQKKRSSKL